MWTPSSASSANGRLPEMLLQDHAARSAQSAPDSTALVSGAERMSYGELETLSSRLAAALVEIGVAPGERVALLVPKRASAIVAMHGVLKAGAAYVPLDTESPAPRLARILAAADPRVVLSVADAAERLGDLAATMALPDVAAVEADPVVSPSGELLSEFTREDWDVPTRQPSHRVGEDDPAHLLFTSGSTGFPKGVVITHRNVNAFLEWALAQFGMRATDRISGHPPLHFDLSTFDIYGSFAAGAELHLVPPTLSVDPRALAAFIREHALTQWLSVPTVLTYMAKFGAVRQDDFPALERLLWCGEVLPTPVLCAWMRRLPHVRFHNLYGPREATIASSHWSPDDIPADESVPVPIGRACAREELRVLDEQLRPVPTGEVGHLYIAGAGLSPGYWRDPEKTAAAFLPDPEAPGSGRRVYRTGDLARVDAEGLVHFLGRADSQIKSRGYRIELGEVESALNAVPEIRECAVVGVDTGGFEGTAICAAVVTSDALEPPELRAALGASLPSYMLPARWLVLDALPKNANGKIDRPALRARFADRRDGRAAR